MKRHIVPVLFAVIAGSGVGWFAWKAYLFLHPLVAGRSSQEVLWAFYRWAGWWWWGGMVVFSVIGLILMFTLSAPRTLWGTITRLFLFGGFIFHCTSWGNNAFGPVANQMMIIGTVMLIAQLAWACHIERRRRNLTYFSFEHRALTWLIGGRPQ